MVRNGFCLLFAILLASNALSAQEAVEKCGTFAVIRQLIEGGKVRAETQFAARPSLQKSRLTANGKVRIHYDTTGANQPAFVTVTYVNTVKTVTRIPNTFEQYIDTVAAIFDSVWRAEIDHFGFDVPPSDGGAGGGDEYDVYVENIGGGIFGVTTPEDPVGPNRTNRQYTTFIRIDNDFGSGYRTNGIEAVLATAAHEFHHAVQIGGAGIWSTQYSFFYELCAEAMEHIVFREAKDYLFDVRTYFRNISSTSLFQRPLSIETAGYERAIWGIFLIKKFGIAVMRDLWTEIGIREPIAALNSVLRARSTSIEREFANFTYWNFFTAYRADSAKYYTDAKLYPAVALYRTVNALPSVQNITLTAGSFSPYYIKAATSTDSAFLIISNTDLADAIADNQSVFTSTLSLSSVEQSGLTAVSSGVYAKFSAVNIENWSYIPIGINTRTFCFPNPFRPDASSLLISLNGIQMSERVTLSVIEASTLDLIYMRRAEFIPFSGTQYVEWKGRDNNGYVVPSGVYMYILSDGDQIVKGKFAVIR